MNELGQLGYENIDNDELELEQYQQKLAYLESPEITEFGSPEKVAKAKEITKKAIEQINRRIRQKKNIQGRVSDELQAMDEAYEANRMEDYAKSGPLGRFSKAAVSNMGKTAGGAVKLYGTGKELAGFGARWASDDKGWLGELGREWMESGEQFNREVDDVIKDASGYSSEWAARDNENASLWNPSTWNPNSVARAGEGLLEFEVPMLGLGAVSSFLGKSLNSYAKTALEGVALGVGNIPEHSKYIEQTSGQFRPKSAIASGLISGQLMNWSFLAGRGRGLSEKAAMNYAQQVARSGEFGMAKAVFKEAALTGFLNSTVNGGVGGLVKEGLALPENPTLDDIKRGLSNVVDNMGREFVMGVGFGAHGAVKGFKEAKSLYNRLSNIGASDSVRRSRIRKASTGNLLQPNRNRTSEQFFNIGAIHETLWKTGDAIMKDKYPNLMEDSVDTMKNFLDEVQISTLKGLNSASDWASADFALQDYRDSMFYAQYKTKVNRALEANNISDMPSMGKVEKKDKNSSSENVYKVLNDKADELVNAIKFNKEESAKVKEKIKDKNTPFEEKQELARQDEELQAQRKEFSSRMEKPLGRTRAEVIESVRDLVVRKYPDNPELFNIAMEHLNRFLEKVNINDDISNDDAIGLLLQVDNELNKLNPKIEHDSYNSDIEGIVNNDKIQVPYSLVDVLNKVKEKKSQPLHVNQEGNVVPNLSKEGTLYADREGNISNSIVDTSEPPIFPDTPGYGIAPSSVMAESPIRPLREGGATSSKSQTQASNLPIRESANKVNGYEGNRIKLNKPTIDTERRQMNLKANMPRESMNISQPRENLPINDRISGKSTRESPSSFKESTSSLNIPQAVKSENVPPKNKLKIDSTDKVGNKAVRDSESFDTKAGMPKSVLSDRTESPAIKNERGKMGLDVEMKQKEVKNNVKTEKDTKYSKLASLLQKAGYKKGDEISKKELDKLARKAGFNGVENILAEVNETPFVDIGEIPLNNLKNKDGSSKMNETKYRIRDFSGLSEEEIKNRNTEYTNQQKVKEYTEEQARLKEKYPILNDIDTNKKLWKALDNVNSKELQDILLAENGRRFEEAQKTSEGKAKWDKEFKEYRLAKSETKKSTTEKSSAAENIVRGKKTKMTTKANGGMEVDGEFAVVDVNDLETSTSIGETQNRNRNTIASQAQINSIANNPNPDYLLVDNVDSANGAMVVMWNPKTKKYKVLSGNGRTLGLTEAYKYGKAGNYQKELNDKASSFNIDKESIGKIKNPVLVRIIEPKDGFDVKRFVKESNESRQLGRNAAEIARTDAENIKGILREFNNIDDITSSSNKEFIQKFFEKTVGDTERANYLAEDGSLTPDGRRRVENALIASLYGDNSRLIEKLTNTTNEGIKNIANALIATAKDGAKLKGEVDKGMYFDVDLTKEIGDAALAYADTVAEMQRQGVKGSPINFYLANMKDRLTPDGKLVFGMLSELNKKPKQVREFLQIINDVIRDHGDPQQGDLFAGKNPKPNKSQIIKEALQEFDSRYKTDFSKQDLSKWNKSERTLFDLNESRARNKATNLVSDKELNNFLKGQAKQITKETGLNFKVVDSVDELRKMFPDNDISDTVEGGIHNDTVYLVKGNIDKDRLPLVIAHEVAGHRGVESLFENKQQMDNFFKSLERASAKDKFIRDAFAEVDRLGYKENRSREAMAKIVEKVRNESGTLKGTAKTFVNFIASRVRRLLRRMGFKNLQLNESEVYDIAVQALRRTGLKNSNKFFGLDRFFAKDNSFLSATSTELDQKYPGWSDRQTTSTGRHSTQAAITEKTYKKIGDWILNSNLKNSKILDASSGMGLGTEALRKMGLNVDDIEPYPGDRKIKPTYSGEDYLDYAEVYKKHGKTYDLIISNAVLNVIPDDWRKAQLHAMADVLLNKGGKLIINVRGDKEVANTKNKIILDSPNEILLPNGNGGYRAYQKGFSQKEFQDWVSKELGAGYKVEKLTPKNSGLSTSTTGVIVTKEGGNDKNNTVPKADIQFSIGERKVKPAEEVARKTKEDTMDVRYPRSFDRYVKKALKQNIRQFHDEFMTKKNTGYKDAALKAAYWSGFDINQSRVEKAFKSIKEFDVLKKSAAEYIKDNILDDTQRARFMDKLVKAGTREGIYGIIQNTNIAREQFVRKELLTGLRDNLKTLRADKVPSGISMEKFRILGEHFTADELNSLLITNKYSVEAVEKLRRVARAIRGDFEDIKAKTDIEVKNWAIGNARALEEGLDILVRNMKSDPSLNVSIKELGSVNTLLGLLSDNAKKAKEALVTDMTNKAVADRAKAISEMKPINEKAANQRNTYSIGMYNEILRPVKALESLDNDNFTAQLGKTFHKIAYEDLLEGQNKQNHYRAEGGRIIDGIIDSFGGDSKGRKFLSETFKKVKTDQGHEYEITNNEAMSAVATYLDRETQKLIEKEGKVKFYLGDKKGSDSFTLTVDQLKEWENALSREQKEALRKGEGMLSNIFLPEMNNTHERLNGAPLRLIAGEYYPRSHVDMDMTSNKGLFDSTSMPYIHTQMNADYQSILKARKNGIPELRLRGFTDTLQSYVDQASLYIGMAEPLRHLNRVLTDGMKKEITQRYGIEYTRRLERMIRLKAGMAGKTESDKNTLSRYLSNVAAAKLTPVSALKQFSSVPLAASNIPFKYLAKAIIDGVSKANIDEMMKLDEMFLRYRNNGIAGIVPLNANSWEKERELQQHGDKWYNKVVDAGLNLSIEADKRALGIIYKATKLMAEAEGKGNDKAWIEKKFMETVMQTQNTTDLSSATGHQEKSRESSKWSFLNMYLNQTQKLSNQYVRLKRNMDEAQKAHGKDSSQYKAAKSSMVNYMIGLGLMNAISVGLGAGASAILHKKDEKKTMKETAAEMATDSLFNFVGNPVLKPVLGGSGYVLQKALPKFLGGKQQRTNNEAFGNDFSNLLPDATYTMGKIFDDLQKDEPAMKKLLKVTGDAIGSRSVESALAMGRVPTWYGRYFAQLIKKYIPEEKKTKKSAILSRSGFSRHMNSRRMRTAIPF